MDAIPHRKRGKRPDLPLQWERMSFRAKRSPMASVRVSNGSSREVYDEPGHLIRRAQQIAVSMFHSTMGNGVTPVQYCVLRVLHEHPGIDQVTLAKFCALDTSTAADLAVRLEERGLVRRMMPMKSKRFRLLHLTAEGSALVKKLVPRSVVLASRLLGALNREEKKVFVHLLKKFVHLNNDESRAPLDRKFTGSRNGGR
jgi:MarR family transcriptional regulator, temperature-dependent positive regulator of motility